MRFLHTVPDIAFMASVWRMRINQYESVAVPIRNWLANQGGPQQGVRFKSDEFVDDVTFVHAPDGKGIAAASMCVIDAGGNGSAINLEANDVVLMTLGSQVADFSTGSMGQAPPAVTPGRSLWRNIAQGRPGFGNPEVFFKPIDSRDSKWVTFTVTTTDPTFFDHLRELTGVDPHRSGLISLIDSPWLITTSAFPEPHFLQQPKGTMAWWGYGRYPDREGDHVLKNNQKMKMWECNGSEILKERMHQFGLQNALPGILAKSICIPCVLPHANSVWLVRKQTDRPRVIPDGAANLAFIGQFSELPQDTMFTMEYSIRSAREAVSGLFKLPVNPPPVYQGQKDIRALVAAAKKFFL